MLCNGVIYHSKTTKSASSSRVVNLKVLLLSLKFQNSTSWEELKDKRLKKLISTVEQWKCKFWWKYMPENRLPKPWKNSKQRWNQCAPMMCFLEHSTINSKEP
jgi:hypothetical protein